MQVLIVDDDEIVLQMLRKVLVERGYDVHQATNARDALAFIRSSACRLVISDWEMPGMSGLELCQAIRSQDLAGYVYFILLTSHDSTEHTIAGLSAGADDFVAKPFNPAELVVRVRAGERIVALETRDVAIFALAKMAESRDPETGAHLERMRSYCQLLARHLSRQESFAGVIDPEFIRLIYLTSPLHDIGKVGIPDAVLLKPGRLSDAEFEIMKTHTTLGASTLDAALRKFPAAQFLQMARDIALTHHERFDGTGYPGKLVGEAIPLCGRIVALADVYDALTNRRIYKQAFSHEIAKSMILSESGTHFDPGIIAGFVACEREFLSIRETFRESEQAAA